MRVAAVLLVLAACDAGSPTRTVTSEIGNPRYEIRISEAQLGANGHSKRDVFVFGTKADGTFAEDAVVVGVDRAGAGTFTKTALQLGPLGAQTFFTPCDQTVPGCLGSAALTLALASDPATIVATVPVELVAPVHVSSAAPCKGPDSAMFFDGQGGDRIRNGILRVTEWQPAFTSVNPATDTEEITLSLTPARPTQGNSWSFAIDSYQLDAPLAVGIYSEAVRNPSQTAGKPGLSVTGDGSGCNTVTGAFEIHELVITAGVLEAVTLSFDQHCDGSTSSRLEGCVRYEKP